jgi:hypothetical protein
VGTSSTIVGKGRENSTADKEQAGLAEDVQFFKKVKRIWGQMATNDVGSYSYPKITLYPAWLELN